MAAEIELKKINEYVNSLVEVTDVTDTYIYGINKQGNSIKISTSSILATCKDWTSTIQSLQELCRGNKQLIQRLQSDLDNKANKIHSHNISDIDGLQNKINSLQSQIDNKSDTDTTYSAGDGININNANEVSVKIDNDTIKLDGQGRLKAAPAVTVDSELSATSENPVQNKVVKAELDDLQSQIDNKSDTDTTYSAGSGINIDGNNNAISVKIDGDSVQLDGQGRLKAAPPVTVDSSLSETSENPVQNKVIKAELDKKTTDSDLAKVAKTGNYNDLNNLPEIRTDFIPKVKNLDDYAAKDGEIVMYVGETTENYEYGAFYKFKDGDNITIPANRPYFQLTEDFPHFPKGYYVYTPAMDKDYKNNYTNYYYHETNLLSGREIKNENGERISTALQNLNIGVGSSLAKVGKETPLSVEFFQIGDIAWDELNNLYKITEITSSALNLELYRQAYKGKCTLDNGHTWIELSEIIGQRVFPLQYFGRTIFLGYPELYVNSRGDTVALFAGSVRDSVKYKYGCFKRAGDSGGYEWLCDGFLNKISYSRYNLSNAEEIYFSGCTDIQTQPYEQVISGSGWVRHYSQPNPEIPEPQIIPDLYIDERNMELQLRKGNEVFSGVDLSFLAKDAVLENAEFITTAEEGVEIELPYFKFTFNADSSTPILRVSLSAFGKSISLTMDSSLSETSENPVQNKVIKAELDKKADEERLDKVSSDLQELKENIQDFTSLDNKLSPTSVKGVQNRTITAAINEINTRMDNLNIDGVVKQIENLDLYNGIPKEIVQYIGDDVILNGIKKYENGSFYKCVEVQQCGIHIFDTITTEGIVGGTYKYVGKAYNIGFQVEVRTFSITNYESAIIPIYNNELVGNKCYHIPSVAKSNDLINIETEIVTNYNSDNGQITLENGNTYNTYHSVDFGNDYEENETISQANKYTSSLGNDLYCVPAPLDNDENNNVYYAWYDTNNAQEYNIIGMYIPLGVEINGKPAYFKYLNGNFQQIVKLQTTKEWQQLNLGGSGSVDIDSELNSESSNAVENKAITIAINGKASSELVANIDSRVVALEQNKGIISREQIPLLKRINNGTLYPNLNKNAQWKMEVAENSTVYDIYDISGIETLHIISARSNTTKRYILSDYDPNTFETKITGNNNFTINGSNVGITGIEVTEFTLSNVANSLYLYVYLGNDTTIESECYADVYSSEYDNELSATSENAVQNKVVKAALDTKATDSELATVAKTGSYNDLTDKPTIPAKITVDSAITQNSTNPVQGGAIFAALANKVTNGGGITEIVVLTQAQYDALATKGSSTFYATTD